MKTLDEFKSAGGLLDGNKGPSHEEYDGAPRAYNSKLETTMEKLGFSGGHNDVQQQQHMGGQSVAGAGAVGAGGAVVGKERGHRNADSGVGMNRPRLGSASSSDYEYAADGQKVKKTRLGNLGGGVGGQVV